MEVYVSVENDDPDLITYLHYSVEQTSIVSTLKSKEGSIHTTTLMTRLLSVDVVTNQAISPAKKPAMDPQIHPHLFALLQVTQRAMGTTADPKMTPMKV